MEQNLLVLSKDVDSNKFPWFYKTKLMTTTALIDSLNFLVNENIQKIYHILSEWKKIYKSENDKIKISNIRINKDYINIWWIRWIINNPCDDNDIINNFYILNWDELYNPLNIEWSISINSMPWYDYHERLDNLTTILMCLKWKKNQ